MSVWCLGRTHYQLGDYGPSYDHLQVAYRLFNRLPPGVESQRLSGRCGIDLVDAARMALPDNAEAVSLAQNVEAKCAVLSGDIVHGHSLVLLGAVLNGAQRHPEALHHLDRARTMLKAVGDIPNLAYACEVISWVHYYENRLPAALDAVEEAWKYAELSDSSFIQAFVSMTFAKLLFSADRDTEAWEYIEMSLMKASYIGDRFQVAYALEFMGYGYLRRADYQNAYGAYEAAAEKYLGTIFNHANGRCNDNMARIKQKEENPDAEVVGFFRHDLDDEPGLFFPPRVQAFASDEPFPLPSQI